MYINTFKYTPADVDCKLCTEYVKKFGCTACGCPWMAERIEAGVVSYAAAVRWLFGGVEHEAFIQRLGQLVLHYRGSFWLSAEHENNTRLLLRSVGYQAWRNPRFFASLYMFGSNRALLKRAWNACMPHSFEPMFLVMRGVSAHDYALIQAARLSCAMGWA